MIASSWRTWLKKVLTSDPKSQGRECRAARSTRLTLESLEDRSVPALIGPEFHVNAITGNNQFSAANASSANGMSVAVWVHRFSATDTDIHAQLYNANGSKRGGELVVASSGSNESAPAVAMDNFGDWKVVWTVAVGANRNVLAARYNSVGTRLGTVAVASSAKNEYDPSVAVNSVGDFVVAYTLDFSSTDQDVLARRFTDGGAFQGAINVSTSAATDAVQSAVARSTGANGVFAIAYSAGGNVFLNRYNAFGGLVNTHTIATGSNSQVAPSVAMSDNGTSVVAWQEFVAGDWDVFARRVGNTGIASSTFTIAATGNNETDATVAMDRSDGDFVVGYRIGTSVYVREMNASGAPKAGPFFVANTGAASPAPAISIDGSDYYFITYTTFGRPSDPGNGVFGRLGRLI